MNRKMVLAIGLLATLLTAGLAFGVIPLVSNHLRGTSLPTPSLVLTGNMTGKTTYVGDTFALTATLGNLTDRLITFYNNNLTIGAVQSVGGVASLNFFGTEASWDFYAETTY